MKAPNVTPVGEVYQRDDGLWQIGVDDAGPGPFETREFAMSIALGCGARRSHAVQSRKSNIGRRGLRDPPETQNSRDGAGHAGVERRNIEELNNFHPSENLRLVKTKKLQRQFGLLPATACVIAELALFAGWSR